MNLNLMKSQEGQRGPFISWMKGRKARMSQNDRTRQFLVSAPAAIVTYLRNNETQISYFALGKSPQRGASPYESFVYVFVRTKQALINSIEIHFKLEMTFPKA